MVKGKLKRYGVFNVVAQPHPENIYREIFEAAIGVGVKYWGDYYAAITPLSETRDDVFTGRLVIWMAVDPESNVISLTDFVEVPLSASNEVVLPADKGLNSRQFQFAFNVRTHKLYLEMKNDEGKSVSSRRAEAALQKSLGEAAEDLVEEFRVQIVPESDGVERILNIPRLNTLEIHILRPNPDGLDEESLALLNEELEGQNAREVVKTLKKAPGFDTLLVSARTKLMAMAASVDGLVRGKGKLEDGQPIDASTKDYPKVVERYEEEAGSEAGGIRSVAGE